MTRNAGITAEAGGIDQERSRTAAALDRPLQVLLLNQFFSPDLSATAQIATELGEDLRAQGFDVSVLTGSGTYLGGTRLPREETYRGIPIRRVATTSFGKRTMVHRALDYASFYASAERELMLRPPPDVVVALTTPPLIAAAALPLKALRGTRLVYWVQDLYPQIAVAVGALAPTSPLTRTLQWASTAVLRRADRVVVLGEAMRNCVVQSGADPNKVSVIPNWSDPDTLRPVPHDSNPVRAALCDGHTRCVVMYSGNMGLAHDMRTLIEAARILAPRRDIRFVFQGGGARRFEVEEAARALPNIVLSPYQDRSCLAESLSAADVHLVSMVPHVTGFMEPSKLYGIMAVGRPLVFVGAPSAEVARAVQRDRCGAVIASWDAAELAAVIAQLADRPDERAAMGRRARQALEKYYARRLATNAFADVLASLRAY